MAHYIEIDSAHRNRVDYPNPSNFVVPFGPASRTVGDPVLTGAIYYQWSSFVFDQGVIVGATSDSITIQSYEDFRNSAVNAYKGRTIYIYPPTGQGNFYTRTILSFDPSKNLIKTTLGSTSNPVGGFYTITYNITVNPASTIINFPYQDKFGNTLLEDDQAYIGYYAMDETLSNGTNIVAQPITYYDNTVRIGYTKEPIPGWKDLDVMSIRKSLPLEKWTLLTRTRINQDPAYGPIGPVITLPQAASSTDDYYKGKYVYFASNGPPTLQPQAVTIKPVYGIFYIKSYKASTRELFVDYDPQGIDLPNLVVNTGTILPNSAFLTMFLSNLTEPSATSSYYIGYTINDITQGTSARIKNFSYQAITNQQGVQLANLYATILDFFLDLNFQSQAGLIGNAYEIVSNNVINIVSLVSDNAVPLDYIGTMTSVNQAVCYKVSLTDLILPNAPLENGVRAAFYPFVYVEIKNVTSPDGAAVSTIYSNNPPSSRAVFMVRITDITQPTTSQFVKLSGSSSHVIKFKPNDSLQFSVTLPDGSYFIPEYPDYFAPYPANPSLQIHATFGLTKL